MSHEQRCFWEECPADGNVKRMPTPRVDVRILASEFYALNHIWIAFELHWWRRWTCSQNCGMNSSPLNRSISLDRMQELSESVETSWCIRPGFVLDSARIRDQFGGGLLHSWIQPESSRIQLNPAESNNSCLPDVHHLSFYVFSSNLARINPSTNDTYFNY